MLEQYIGSERVDFLASIAAVAGKLTVDKEDILKVIYEGSGRYNNRLSNIVRDARVRKLFQQRRIYERVNSMCLQPVCDQNDQHLRLLTFLRETQSMGLLGVP